MAKLRMTVGSLRKMVDGLAHLIEAEDDDPETTEPEKKKGTLREPPPPGTRYVSDPKSGTGKVRSSAVKNKPGYDPLLPREDTGKSPGWLAIYDPIAYKALKQMGSPDGRIYTSGPYVMFRPKDPSQKAMFWAGVPEKKKLQGTAVVRPEHGEAKPHAWRTYEELGIDQKRGLGWVEPRDRGQVPDTGKEPEEQGLGVRFKGGAGARVEPDVMGFVPGAEPIVPGKGGSIPSPEAMSAMQRGMAAKHARLPDWETLSIQDLNGWLETATKKYKTSRDPGDLRVLQAIRSEMGARAEGKQQKTPPPRPEAQRAPRHTQSAEERFGKRKRWGTTSSGAEVTRVEKPKK